MKTSKKILTALVTPMLLASSLITAQANIFQYNVTLNGLNESPANASPGSGLATIFLDTTLNTLSLNMSFSGLTGPTSAAHIHGATAVAGTGTAGVATTVPTFTGFPLGVTSGTYSTVLDLTQLSSYNPAYVTANGGTALSSEAALIAAIQAGKTYLNIHTSTFGGGEIRGFLTPVPEPTTLALLGVGSLLLARAARRR